MSDEVLRLDALSYSRGEKQILKDIFWSAKRGTLGAILGANGCGKSTLLRLICGYLWPQKGTVHLLGETLGQVEIAKLRRKIGIVEATTIYPFDENMTTHQVVTSGYFTALTLGYIHPTPDQLAHARHLLSQVGLEKQADQLYFTLSTGQRMRALIARALVRKPELILLDEPTAALDLPARESVLATLARLHKTQFPPAIITVTHHLEELLPNTENILLLSPDGRSVAQGHPQIVLTDAHLSQAYGLPIHVTSHNNRYHAQVHPNTWNDLLN